VSLLEEGFGHLKNKNYHDARRTFLSVLTSESSVQEKKQSIKELEKLLPLGIEKAEKRIFFKAGFDFFFNEKDFQEAIKYYDLLVGETDHQETGEDRLRFLSVLIEAGNLERARSLSKQVLIRLNDKKCNSEILKIISFLKSYGLNESGYGDLQRAVEIRIGSVNESIKFIESCLSKDNNSSKKSDEQSIKRIFDEVERSEHRGHKKLKALSSLYLHSLTIEAGIATLADRKSFISAIYEYILLDGKAEIVGKMVLIYARVYRRKEIVLHVLRHADEHGLSKLFKIELEKLGRNLEKFSGFKLSLDDVDLGEDLFKDSLSNNKRKEEQVRRLEAQLNIAEQKGMREESAAILSKIRELDPENELFRPGSQVEERSVEKNRDGEKVKDSLIKEISQYIKKTEKNDETKAYEKEVISSLKVYESVYNFIELKELLVASLSMQAYEISQYVLSQLIDRKSLSKTEEMYFQITVWLGEGRFHKAVDLADEALQLEEISWHEQTSFLYQKAEALKGAGKKKQALECFKRVYERDSSFRIVKTRIRELA
jgi:tetratricopeptide (TPR) repeat protein